MSFLHIDSDLFVKSGYSLSVVLLMHVCLFGGLICDDLSGPTVDAADFDDVGIT